MASTEKALGTAVIGCGRISRSHLAAINHNPQLARLVAVVDENEVLRTRAAADYGSQLALSSVDEVLAHDEVEAVVICLPNDLHAPVALAAARAGKHVLVEKPMATSAADALAMAEAASAANITLAVAQCRRHFRAIQALNERRTEFGELISVQVSLGVKWHAPQADWWRDPVRADSLVVALNGPHVLDFVHMMMGELPLRVSCESARRQEFWGGADEAMILLSYPGDRLASVHLSFNQDPLEDRKVLVFEKGTAVVEQDRRLLFNGEVLVEPGSDEGRHYLDEAIEFSRQFEEFVRAVRGQNNRSVLAHEGVAVIQTLEAAILANKTHHVVHLEPADGASVNEAAQPKRKSA